MPEPPPITTRTTRRQFTVVMDLPCNDFGEPLVCGAQILRDAIGEFIDERTPPIDYVRRRYASQPSRFRSKKVPQVKLRIQAAESSTII